MPSRPAQPSTRPAPPAERAAPATPGSVEVVGVALALTDYARMIDWIDAMVASRERGYVCVAAVHTVMASREDPELRAAVRGGSLTVPDGQPLVWAINALGHDLRSRVYGPELMDRYCARAATTGTRLYLYGGRDEAALRRLSESLLARHPGLQIVGGSSPPFRPLRTDEEDAIAEEINGSGADVVWVGIGVPKQEKWMARMRDRLEAPVLIGVGAAFDFHAGLVSQAPSWMQRAGLEWAYRLGSEPRRLWSRYARYNPLFVLAFARQYLRHRRSRARS